MPQRLMSGLLNLAQRQDFLGALPIFSSLESDESQELAILMHEIHFARGEAIVKEGQFVDSVFIITQGEAEVSHKKVSKGRLIKKITHIPLGIKYPGDSIGLNDTGFFSTTGKRTATVIALTEVAVLEISLSDMHYFFKNHPHLQSSLSISVNELLRFQLIRQSLPFTHLSHERLHWLAKKVEDILIPEGAIIFEQGETGKDCYLVRRGHVEISTRREDGSKRILAILKSPTLFGEATLITSSSRNATARALDDCELLVLHQKYLFELLETENKTAATLMDLMVERSRPTRNPDIISHHRLAADKQPIVILKNPENSHYFKLSEEGWFIWQKLNGTETLQDITLALAERFNIFAPNIVTALISKLADSGFVLNVHTDTQYSEQTTSPLLKFFIQINRLLTKRIVIGDADSWLSSFYKNGLYILFTKIGLFCLAIVVLSGLISFGLAMPHIIKIFTTMPHAWWLFILLFPCMLLAAALHELGHAMVMKSFGYEVHFMGIGWYWLGPIAFTDTSEMWFSPRWPRIAVNLGGVCTDLLTAGIMSLLIFVVPNPYVQAFLWLFAIYIYFGAFKMLSPLQEFDGYYILMDILERTRLRQKSVIWLAKDLPKNLHDKNIFRNHIPEIVYWVACFIFLILVSLLTFLVQSFVFKILGYQPRNVFIILVIPISVSLFWSLSLVGELLQVSDD